MVRTDYEVCQQLPHKGQLLLEVGGAHAGGAVYQEHQLDLLEAPESMDLLPQSSAQSVHAVFSRVGLELENSQYIENKFKYAA